MYIGRSASYKAQRAQSTLASCCGARRSLRRSKCHVEKITMGGMCGFVPDRRSTRLCGSECQYRTADALTGIKGIGPVKAQAIIQERAAHGPYKNAEDLAKRVKGLGAKSTAKLQE